MGIDIEPLPSPLQANALTGCLLARVTHRSKHAHLLVSANHHKLIQFHIISSPLAPVVLGQPWLRLHNPHIDCSAAKIVSWSSYCHATGLRSARSPAGVVSRLPPSSSTRTPHVSLSWRSTPLRLEWVLSFPSGLGSVFLAGSDSL